MEKLVSLKDLQIEVIGGQIMGRVKAKSDFDESNAEKRKVIVPKAICSDGTIDVTILPEEVLQNPVNDSKITRTGDIVIKLSTPYDAAMIKKESENCVVPSFCAIVRYPNYIDGNYLTAFLNSDFCKEQLKMQVAGVMMTVLSVGKVLKVLMPKPSLEIQKEIGLKYIKTQEKLEIIKKIVTLETKRNDVVFRELARNYE